MPLAPGSARPPDAGDQRGALLQGDVRFELPKAPATDGRRRRFGRAPRGAAPWPRRGLLGRPRLRSSRVASISDACAVGSHVPPALGRGSGARDVQWRRAAPVLGVRVRSRFEKDLGDQASQRPAAGQMKAGVPGVDPMRDRCRRARSRGARVRPTSGSSRRRRATSRSPSRAASRIGSIGVV